MYTQKWISDFPMNYFLKQTEEALEKINRQKELILNSASEGILGLDLNGNHIFVNPAAAQMLGYSVKELLGKHAHEIWHHSRADGSPYPEAECPICSVCKHRITRHIKDEVFWRKNNTSFDAFSYSDYSQKRRMCYKSYR
jgi:PAS domain-containing protein